MYGEGGHYVRPTAQYELRRHFFVFFLMYVSSNSIFFASPTIQDNTELKWEAIFPTWNWSSVAWMICWKVFQMLHLRTLTTWMAFCMSKLCHKKVQSTSVILYMARRKLWRRSQKQRLTTWAMPTDWKHSRPQITLTATTTIWGCHRSPNHSQNRIIAVTWFLSYHNLHSQPRNFQAQHHLQLGNPENILLLLGSGPIRTLLTTTTWSIRMKKSGVICRTPVTTSQLFHE